MIFDAPILNLVLTLRVQRAELYSEVDGANTLFNLSLDLIKDSFGLKLLFIVPAYFLYSRK